jgi:hypothetical protein
VAHVVEALELPQGAVLIEKQHAGVRRRGDQCTQPVAGRK